jgi:type II secretory pathway pseudopilin PulG
MMARRGFVLLEAVVALLIVSTFAISALAALGGRLHGAGAVERTLTARTLAEDRFAAIELLPAVPQPLPDSLARGVFAAPFTDYRWTASVKPVRDEENLYDVVVTATHDDGSFTLRGRLFRAPVITDARGR